MPPEEAQRALAMWTRPRSGDAQTRTGAGLGLPIAAGLVQMFGGKLKIQTSPGQGTKCEFTVRFLKQQTLMEPQRDDAAASGPLAGKRVLLAVANDTARRWLSEMCERLGLQTLISEPSFAAAANCANTSKQAPDVALLDSDLLPRDAGGAVQQEVLAKLPPAKVLVRSSVAPAASAAECRSWNVAALIFKPVFEDELRDALLLAVGRQAVETRGGGSATGAAYLKSESSFMQCQPQEAIGRLGGDKELYGDVVRRFLDDAPTVLEQLRAHITAEQAEPLHRTAHAFKGLAGMCGAVSVAQIAGELEGLGKQSQLTEAPAAVERLTTALEHARGELTPYATS
jgi:HPt (histidine-containing phosphotransfer) domain-containing protein